MSAPEKIVAYTTTTLAKNIKLTYKSRLWEENHCPFMPDNARLYIRQDIHEATLAERDATIAELRAESARKSEALNNAADDIDALSTLTTKELASAFKNKSNKYRAIAKDTK